MARNRADGSRRMIQRRTALVAAAMTVTGAVAGEANAAAVLTSVPQPFAAVGPLSNQYQSATRSPNPNVVTTGDTFSFDIAGFNTSTGSGVFITSNSGSGVLTATFGTTTTFAAGVASGQTLTVASAETITPTITTDTISLSVPSTFVTAGSTFTGTINGSSASETINALQFDIGQSNGGTNPINFLVPINTATNTTSGSITYGTANTVFSLNPGTTFGTGGTSFAESEGVNVGTSDIGSLGVHVFSVSVSYATTPVPEPVTATAAAALFAATGLRRRRRPITGGSVTGR